MAVAVMVVAVAVIVTVSVPIPTMVVFEAAPVSLPVTRKKLLAIVMRRYPHGPGIRWAAPIPFVPPVVSANRIPVALNPNIVWTGARRLYRDYARGRGSADTDANREIGGQSGSDRHENQKK
jgi:hypothetical protein